MVPDFSRKKEVLEIQADCGRKEAGDRGSAPSRVLDAVRKSAAVRPTEHGLQTDKDASFC